MTFPEGGPANEAVQRVQAVQLRAGCTGSTACTGCFTRPPLAEARRIGSPAPRRLA